MHNMFDENAKHGKFLHLFPSLLSSRSQLILNGGRYSLIPDRPGNPANHYKTLERIHCPEGVFEQEISLVYIVWDSDRNEQWDTVSYSNIFGPITYLI